MSEIKGQLLGLLMLLVVFGSAAGVITAAINHATSSITQKVNSEESYLQAPKTVAYNG